MDSIQSEIRNILIDKLGLKESELTPTANFVKDLGIDSLDYAELVMEFEQAFDIRIPDQDAEKLQNLEKTVEYITSKINK
ncbi:MAG: acyl carrier protein [Cyclobacteriaceae bacterium]|nr:acyl carrier protein [Cyclobacteriaceae bacterium]MCH8516628.1 acyl carrier protein [Cyclobacteriaceae bacterium]